MSLNDDELTRTVRELQANLALSGLTKSEVGVDLHVTPDRLDAVLSATQPSDPVDVWQLRDYLEQAVTDVRADSDPVLRAHRAEPQARQQLVPAAPSPAARLQPRPIRIRSNRQLTAPLPCETVVGGSDNPRDRRHGRHSPEPAHRAGSRLAR